MKALICSLAVVPLMASGATIVESHVFSVSTVIPDNSAIGVSDSRVSVSDIESITSVELTLVTSGGWNGDLYVYLLHGSGFSVLLNRAGRTLLNPDGAASSGMVLTFSDSASGDVHAGIAASGVASGTFQPDGRETDPANALDTDSRTALLSSFGGLNADGEWTLFVADAATGEIATFESWTLTLTGVPEPSSALLAGLGCLMAFRRRR
ncbi:proprotein convertase P-domain-containing protein [Luteolibacter soli]|uniref:Proprotein convertase P-domain-containing protein n=1 Tax=Luteolibacter soli TaxID=3135280 RepID=A0ABU9AX73_9BACT